MEGKVIIAVDREDDHKPFLYFTFNGEYENWDSLEFSEIKSDYDIVSKMFALASSYSYLKPESKYIDPDTKSEVKYNLEMAHAISEAFDIARFAELAFEYDENAKKFAFKFDIKQKYLLLPGNVKGSFNKLDATMESSSNWIEFDTEDLREAFTRMVATLSIKIPEMLENSIVYTKQFNGDYSENIAAIIDLMSDENFVQGVDKNNFIEKTFEYFMEKLGIKKEDLISENVEVKGEDDRVNDFLSEFGEDE